LSTKLKRRHAGALIAGLTLSIAILAVLLPGWAEAQEVDTDAVSIETAQATTNDQPNGADELTTTATTSTVTPPQNVYEPAAAAALVVEPGDSLWAIAQERLGPEATSQQVAEETTKIYELNRERIGDDPNLIFPGQELLLTQRPEPAADLAPTTGVATETVEGPAADGLAEEEPATLEQPTAADEEAVPDPTQDESAAENDEPSHPSPYYSEQREPDMLTVLISLGFFLGSLAVAALAVAKLLGRRRLLGETYRSSSYEPLTGPQEEDNDDDHSAERGAPSPEAEPKTESEAEPAPQGPAASAVATRDTARRRRRQRAVLAGRRQRRWRRGRYTER
jgi:hypothetical protein